MKLFWGAILVLGIFVSGFYVFISSSRSLTPLESVLLQLTALALSMGGSFFLGRQFSKSIPSARSAFRRVRNLYDGLSIIATGIESSRTNESIEEYRRVMSLFEGVVRTQLIAADDALEDWKDLVPDDVADLQRGLDAEARK